MDALVDRLLAAGLPTPLRRTEEVPFYRNRYSTWMNCFPVLEWPHYELPGCYLLLHLHPCDEKYKAEAYACNPFGSQPGTCYLLKAFKDLHTELDEFLPVARCCLPDTTEPDLFCRLLKEALEGEPAPRFQLEKSSYTNQLAHWA